jgi:pimeloyl-ACP methyl ester carboxylesterase|tara:strand:+ start:11462 stop:12364 length:903 start_codon:yes stop_codon:yes gene_type:complete
MSEPAEKQIKINGVSLTVFEWGEQQLDTVLLVHATGFHARCWDQVVNNLGDCHVVAVDMRGHGRSEKTGPFAWDVFGQDVTELVAVMDLTGLVGVGHSMGGHSVTQAAANEPDRFKGLVLVDPVIMSPEMYAARREHEAAQDSEGQDGQLHPVARRRNSFADADEMFYHMENRGSYAVWNRDVLRDYCDYGVLPNADGGDYALACPPEIEASIYTGSSGRDIYDKIDTISMPVKVLRARERSPDSQQMDFSTSPTWSGLADRFQQGEDIQLPDLTHFIPMQEPALVADHIKDSLTQQATA